MSNNKRPKLSLTQLNPLCKNLFLKYSIHEVIHKPMGPREKEVKFGKFLLISKKYLQTFRQHKIFEFVISGTEIMGLGMYRLSQKQDDNFWIWLYSAPNYSMYKKVSFDHLVKINKLLNVQFVRLNFRYETALQDFEKMANDVFGGKLALTIYDYTSLNYIELIQKYSKRFYWLSSGIEIFLDPQIPALNLEFFEGKHWNKFDQLKEILSKHGTQKLTLFSSLSSSKEFFDSDIFDLPTFFADFPFYPRLNFLKLKISRLRNKKVLEVLHQMTQKFMPNLKTFDLELDFAIKGETHVPQSIFSIIDEIRQIKKDHKNLHKMDIDINFGYAVKDFEDVSILTINEIRRMIHPFIKIENSKDKTLKEITDLDDFDQCYFQECVSPSYWKLGTFEWSEGTGINFKINVTIVDLDTLRGTDAEEEYGDELRGYDSEEEGEDGE